MGTLVYMHQYDCHQLILFSGKGGVGKTTLSCAFARRWANQFPNEQILLLSTDPAHSLGDVLQQSVTDSAQPLVNLPNLSVRSLDAEQLLIAFKAQYGEILELLVERGSFVEGEDLSPVWDMRWPGLDELMGLLEIQRLLKEKIADRIVVDMAPTGHALNLLGLMDFLDHLLDSVELFQEKHRVMARSFTGRYTADEVDDFLVQMKGDLSAGRQLIQDPIHTACLVVAIAEPMSFLESDRLLKALSKLQIPCGGLLMNRILSNGNHFSEIYDHERYCEQQIVLEKFRAIASPIFLVPQQTTEPLGAEKLDQLIATIDSLDTTTPVPLPPEMNAIAPEVIDSLDTTTPVPLPPEMNAIAPEVMEFPEQNHLSDFLAEGRRLIIVGGKGGVGKTTVAAAIGWKLAQSHPEKNIRIISIDPAHSLGDAFGQELAHEPVAITDNLSGQEIDAETILTQFREDYLWELAAMMSGEANESDRGLKLAYSPQAWRQIVAEALPGIDEMLALIEIIQQLESQQQDFIILDTAPTGHLLRFLEMPTALSDWLAWIFKLWMKYRDVLGRIEFMSRLRTLRQRVVQAQKLLTDPQHTEFIAVVQAEEAILAESVRLAQSLQEKRIAQRYIVHNRYQRDRELSPNLFPDQTIIHLPILSRLVSPLTRIQQATHYLF